MTKDRVAPYTLVMEVKQGIARDLVNSEVLPPLEVRGANVTDEACKTYIIKVLKQGTLVEDDAITQSGYYSMQASDVSVKLPAKNGYKTQL